VNRLIRTGRAALVAAVVSALAAACSAEVARENVAATLTEQLVRQGVQPENLTCQRDLPATVDASVPCTFTVDGQPVDAIATVTSVDGGTAHYKIETRARPVAQAALEQRISDDIARRTGKAPDSVSCAGDLPPSPGGTVLCKVGDDRTAQVTVTSVNLGEVTFQIQER
jgi:hypothetical protein